MKKALIQPQFVFQERSGMFILSQIYLSMDLTPSRKFGNFYDLPLKLQWKILPMSSLKYIVAIRVHIKNDGNIKICIISIIDLYSIVPYSITYKDL